MDAAEIAELFGLGRVVRLSDGPVARGKQGVVWRLDTSDGRWALKAPFSSSAEDEVEVTTSFQERAYDAGVPTPQVRRSTGGRVFAVVGGTQVRVYDWVDLGAPDPRLDPELVGSVVAAMHRLAVPAVGGVDSWHREPVGAGTWDELVRRLAEERAPFAARLRDLRDELVGLESWIEEPTGLQMCHCDLWADNLLPTSDGVCVLDWENSGPADPSHELGYVLFEYARADVGRARALTDAYRDAGGPGAVTGRGDFTMLIAQLGHITEIAARDWLAPNDRSPRREDAEAWISEVFDEPHTRELLAGLLDGLV
jgi:Ser/Thr protein kinase RdoA (MazF antagonist)